MSPRALLTLLAILTLTLASISQDKQRGVRFKRDGQYKEVYMMTGPDSNDATIRLMDQSFYFKVIPDRKHTIGGVEHTLVFIPDKSKKTWAAPTDFDPINSGDWGKHFWVRTTDLEKIEPSYFLSSWKKPTIQVNALTIPIIIRPKRGDLAFDGGADLNIGASLGFRYRLNDTKNNFLMPLGFIGISTFKFTATNNSGLADGDEDQSGGGFVVGGGLTLQLAEANVGFFMGCDKAYGAMGKTYAYQDALWLGVGVGVKLFNTGSGTGTAQ